MICDSRMQIQQIQPAIPDTTKAGLIYLPPAEISSLKRTNSVHWKVADQKHLSRAKSVSKTHSIFCECKGSGLGCLCGNDCSHRGRDKL